MPYPSVPPPAPVFNPPGLLEVHEYEHVRSVIDYADHMARVLRGEHPDAASRLRELADNVEPILELGNIHSLGWVDSSFESGGHIVIPGRLLGTPNHAAWGEPEMAELTVTLRHEIDHRLFGLHRWPYQDHLDVYVRDLQLIDDMEAYQEIVHAGEPDVDSRAHDARNTLRTIEYETRRWIEVDYFQGWARIWARICRFAGVPE